MKQIVLFLFLIISCADSSYNLTKFHSAGANCDFTPLMSIGNKKFHRREKAVFYASPELFEIAKEAADLLSYRIGIDLFEIRELKEGEASNNRSYIYISTDEAHYEQEKKRKEPGDYLAYCSVSQKYNKDTGEMYISDIVFNPILYDRERELYKKIKRNSENKIEYYKEKLMEREKKGRRYCSKETYCEQYESQPDIYNECLNLVDRLRETTEKQCLKEVRKDIKKLENLIEDTEDDSDDYFDDWKEDIRTRTLLTMIHEFGHALGFKHTPNDIENIMYPNNNNTGSVLTGRQVNAVRCAFGLGRFN